MPRGKKPDGEKRDNRLTVYLTEHERDKLCHLAENEGRAMTQIVVLAVEDWARRMSGPSADANRASFETVMNQYDCILRGHVCRNGHAFWVESLMGARFCPICGSERELKRTWDGRIRRGP